MPINKIAYKNIKNELAEKNVQLIAVSKIKPIEDIIELYKIGQKDFAENYVQELVSKYNDLKSLHINWHFIGHLQTNKVKYIAEFVYLIQSVDSLKLLLEINKQAKRNSRVINCLLQIHIAQEETKFGLNELELKEIMNEYNLGNLSNILILGLMGMASFTNDETKVRKEFQQLNIIFKSYNNLKILSMGMSQDYNLAIEEGSSMIRIGSLLFGSRA